MNPIAQCSRIVVFLVLAFFASLAHAVAMPVPSPPQLASKSHILVDYDSGQVLAESHADERMEPASITKLMTAYVVYQALASGDISLDDEVRVSERAWKMKGSQMFLEVGEKLTVRELLMGLIVQSGNDAALALAEHVAGTEGAFATYMNHQAKVLGMDNTHFVNATGWPEDNHYTTARDISRLMAALIRDFPERYKMYATREYTYNDITQYNRNKLLWRDSTVDGGKTGHTESAGYCLTASAKREGMRLISVVLGASSDDARVEQNQALLNYGFRFFETRKLKAAGENLMDAEIWKGERDTLPVGLENDLYVTIPRGKKDQLDVTVDLKKQIIAPVAKGEQQGRLRVALGEAVLAEEPLVALEPVAEGGLVGRAVDSLMLMIK